MSTTIQIIDPNREIVAQAQVIDESNRYEGTIDLDQTPANMRKVFDEFEEMVDGQMFSFLDEIQEKIASLSLQFVFPDGETAAVSELQVFPGMGDLSFKLVEIAAHHN